MAIDVEARMRELLGAEMLKRSPGPGMPARIVATTWPNDMFPAATLEVVLAALRSQREEVIEECAAVAWAHKGKAAELRQARKVNMALLTQEARDEIKSEERGEDIAAEIIADAIRALTVATHPTEAGNG
jgi:hypothetical protein